MVRPKRARSWKRRTQPRKTYSLWDSFSRRDAIFRQLSGVEWSDSQHENSITGRSVTFVLIQLPGFRASRSLMLYRCERIQVLLTDRQNVHAALLTGCATTLNI